jgi:glycosyltransferase involved in cell wall biosynthesis
MKFSIIVPFLNEECFLKQCIDALQDQKIPRDQYELIFIDNGSTDNSAKIVKSYPDILYLTESIKDAYLARNRGIQAAKGEIILFIDADCIATKELLKAYEQAFQNPALGIVIGRLNFPRPVSFLVKYYEDYYATKMRLMASMLPRETCYGHAGNMAVRANLFKVLGLFAPMPIVGDAEIVQKYLKHAPEERMAYLDQAVVTHMEVISAFSLLKKLYSYGIYSKTLSQSSAFRVATMQEKLLTLSSCIKENGFSVIQQLLLTSALIIHYCAFALGCLKVSMFGSKVS